jgi:hypothetical protein
MNIHENARTTPVSRALLVRLISDDGWSVGSGGGGRCRPAHRLQMAAKAARGGGGEAARPLVSGAPHPARLACGVGADHFVLAPLSARV